MYDFYTPFVIHNSYLVHLYLMTSDKIKSLPDATQQVKAWQAAGQKVVFTNGCFDLLHLGHVDYLENARNMGDRLVIGLNSDSSVSRFKGPERPLQDQNSRARVLAALQFVDLVVFFNEDTPLELISQLLPNVLVKGSDYLAENIVGADVVKKNGGVVKTIDFVPGYSTTKIVEKIKKS
jgi:D-glycero-beta-D-manno-heptose 1-phosphate adenylyltransferase